MAIRVYLLKIMDYASPCQSTMRATQPPSSYRLLTDWLGGDNDIKVRTPYV